MSEQKLSPVHIPKTVSVESYLQRLKTNVVTHQMHMTHKSRFNTVSCLFSCWKDVGFFCGFFIHLSAVSELLKTTQEGGKLSWLNKTSHL